MGVYIKNWSLADWKELLKWAKIGANNAMIGEFAEAEEAPPHGRLIDADVLCKVLQKNSECEWNNKIAPFSWAYAYDCVKDTVEIMPTIIEAEEGE